MPGEIRVSGADILIIDDSDFPNLFDISLLYQIGCINRYDLYISTFITFDTGLDAIVNKLS